MDAVFANIYVHHTPDPLAAIREMVRLLKPGNRLVITDMDRHPYAWMKEEMADVWMGFERGQVRQWFKEAGLMNVIVDCSGQSCCAEAQATSMTDAAGRKAEISIFVAVGTKRVEGVREAVQADYGAAATSASPQNNTGCCSTSDSGGSCCSGGSTMNLIGLSQTDSEEISPNAAVESSCCGGGSSNLISLDALGEDVQLNTEVIFNPNYSVAEQQAVPEDASGLALGCGNPTAFAGLQPGEMVLDIGSGAGMDALLAGRQVGPSCKVIGGDMTPEMLERARRGAAKAGLEQIEFR